MRRTRRLGGWSCRFTPTNPVGGSLHGDLILCLAPTPNHPYQQPPRPPTLIQSLWRRVLEACGAKNGFSKPDSNSSNKLHFIPLRADPLHYSFKSQHPFLPSAAVHTYRLEKKKTCTNNRWRVLNKGGLCFLFFLHQDFSLFSEYLICTGSHVLLNSMLFCFISAISSLQLSACLSERLMLGVELPAEQGDHVR